MSLTIFTWMYSRVIGHVFLADSTCPVSWVGEDFEGFKLYLI